MKFEVTHPEVAEAVRRALEEDIGSGDITSIACVPEDQDAAGRFIAREPMVVAGSELLAAIYGMRGGGVAQTATSAAPRLVSALAESRQPSTIELEILLESGRRAEPGDVIATVRGRTRTLLECERVALNFMQRLSGIATLARRYADAVAGTKCRVLDTRKTTPGLRRLEKMAAAAGGATNHRMGLFDAVLIKNNHIAAAGGIRQALERALQTGRKVEIEVGNRKELEEALAGGASHLLLDNLSPEEAAEYVRAVAGRATIELSGGITLENIRAYAEAGADFISCGAITHSARAVDINFRLEG
jgi:nicotinate-nucleotide pyrophosphorylase (carboxylating)